MNYILERKMSDEKWWTVGGFYESRINAIRVGSWLFSDETLRNFGVTWRIRVQP